MPGAAAWGTRLECTAIAAPGSPLTAGTPWLLRVDFEVGRPTASLVAAVALAVRRGPVLVTLASTAEDLSPGAYRTELVVDLPLAPGELSLSVHLLSGDRLLYAADDVSHVRLDEAPGGGRAPHGVRGLLVAAGRAPIVRVAPRRPGD